MPLSPGEKLGPYEILSAIGPVGWVRSISKRFLVLTPAGGSQPLEVIVNGPALLKKGVAE